MKKLFAVIVAVVFLASFAFAQNTSTVSETGDYNKAAVTQIGSNSSTVTQMSMIGGTAGKGTETTIQQIGVGNSSIVTQDRSGGQQAHLTTASVMQTGDNNNSTITQDGYYQGSNSSSVTQHGIDDGVGNTAEVAQSGYGNNWTILQEGDENFAHQEGLNTVHNGTTNRIEQNGLKNEAYQYTSGSDDMHATIYQREGVTDNYAEQTQAGLKNEAIIDQSSSSNQAYQEQYHGSYHYNGVYARQHYARITQTGGDGNYAEQYQDENIGDVWANSRNESIILQDGSLNNSTVLQFDGLNTGNVTQIGNSNLGNITQNTVGNTATINQTGLNNDAQVIQQ